MLRHQPAGRNLAEPTWPLSSRRRRPPAHPAAAAARRIAGPVQLFSRIVEELSYGW